ncbi:MAG: hypothetical protein IT222_07785, partial [Crocinitomix sp.]|nr:hypothetical protein [Crocinitomix sp.]
MTKRQIRKEIKLGIQNGKSKQAVFDELNETCGLEPEVLAKLVQAVPSLEAQSIVNHRQRRAAPSTTVNLPY